MPGLIRAEDVALVRERAPIAQVIGQHVTLRQAGGRMTGLCPFHEEKSPSFSVSPDRGMFYCFGCGVGGDVIKFVQEIEHLSFTDAVESLARTAGVELRYEQGGAAPRQQAGQRQRLLEAHTAAAEWFVGQLATPAARAGREFLVERGFDDDAVARFGVGFAPQSWDSLVKHLRGRGFTQQELLTGGIASEGRQGPIDRFRGRLVWPIRDVKGDVIGFGARRLFDDDTGPKYLNTPETPLYRKSQVLYGLDLAKGEIARRMQAVVVEGYTDVMACHLAGVPTAVATCGTAFGADHVGILRRLLMDQDEFRGRVIFTFDGDEAGRKAALRAFDDDQRFVAQTFVAVEREGRDPCELRMARGDAAVRELVADHVPLSEFAVRTVIERYDLDLPEGRVSALAAAAPVVARIKDRALRPEYARRLAGWLGMDVDDVVRRVAELADTPAAQQAARGARAAGPAASSEPRAARPDPRDPRFAVEREALKVAVQSPDLAGAAFDEVGSDVFTSPAYAAVHRALVAAGGVTGQSPGPEWVRRVHETADNDAVRGLVTELAVEPLHHVDLHDRRYAASVVARLREMAVTRRIRELSSKLQRLNPVEQQDDYNRLFGDLIALEQHKRGLREQAIGAL